MTENSPSTAKTHPDSHSSTSAPRINTIIMSAISDPARPLNGDGPASPSPGRHPSISLQAAATLNASLQRESPSRRSTGSPLSPSRHSPISDRRRSQVHMNLQIADPAVPAPGEMLADHHNNSFQEPFNLSPRFMHSSPRLVATGEPTHQRAPSLGEIHQELENEQEYQVNRLLAEIRRLQDELDRKNRFQGAGANDEATTGSVPIPTSHPSNSSMPGPSSGSSVPRSPGFPHHPRSSFDVTRAELRRRSRTPSRGASPRLRSTSISGDSGEQWLLGSRDENAFYQAETQALTRENQMLKKRIKELGKIHS
ncbi:hypothetical protein QBC38DRAFT_182268 [Podospora fimiseda]|uniref:Uncharacterized protein n=1 Tax=Podospora fimiseda TaxID=252190 RepID=A0AAN7BR11_9PEZI|nr:hypothetical protein QBC38DRAFT_182268 [Podospora fimiseda]